MQIALIVATDSNDVIGINGKIPWMGQLPEDMRRFKSLTTGHPVIMGRKTFESLPGVLPGRTNIVLSKTLKNTPREARLARTTSEALEIARSAPGQDICFIIGGAEVYAAFLPHSDVIYLTRLTASFTGEATYFPQLSLEKWRVESITEHPPDEKNKYHRAYITFKRELPA